MSAAIVNEIREGFYVDSVALMRLSRDIAGMEGVQEAAMMMGTPSNREIMADAELLIEAGEGASSGDLIIGIRADSAEVAQNALARALSQLDRQEGRAESAVWQPRTLRAALKAMPDASLALISVAGEFAVAEARSAIRRGLHVMIFSDNVSLADEADLKHEARELGCLVMGPDCGTAIINGTPLAFANSVPRGNIGIIGASGTGTQEVSCLIAQYGGGVSHAIGVGGRDLKSEVGGISTLMAIDALSADRGTDHLVLISKPPPVEVAENILARVAEIGMPATICFIGAGEMGMPANAVQALTLKAAARASAGLDVESTAAPSPPIEVPAGRARVLGLFSGGTLCAEAQVVFRAADQEVCSNAPIPGSASVHAVDGGHTLLDLGDDEYTRGRPHPMIDPSVRDAQMIEALTGRNVGAVLVDVVIGYGAHGDPAGHIARVVERHARPGGPPVIASVTGTESDPQMRSAQTAKLQAAGVFVAPTNADAAAWALAAIESTS